MVASPSLDETLDVEKLIPGSLSAIRTTSRALADTASDFVAIAGMLSQVEVAGWKGAAADEFRKKWHGLPESWAAAAKSYRNAHSAFVEYQNAFDTARSAAEDAVVLYRRGQEATSAALAHFHAEQAARAAEQAGKPYEPGPKSVAIGQGFHDPGETFRREAQRDLDDARVRLHRAAHTASLTILDGVALVPKVPPTGWDQFWGGVNGVIEFPGNVVEGFLISGWLKLKVAEILRVDSRLSIAEALNQVRDSVRYTAEIPGASYSQTVTTTVEGMRVRGYELVLDHGKSPNRWGDDGYRGVNTSWIDPTTGRTFKLQFHTPESFEMKTETHSLYEAMKVPGNSKRKLAQLKATNDALFATVPIPPGAIDLSFAMGG